MPKCLSNRCRFLTHKNGGDYCCNACKNNGGRHGGACGRIVFKGGLEERVASSEQMTLSMSPLFDLSNCNVVFNPTVGNVQKNYKITLAWEPVVGATSYKVVYTYYCGSPVHVNSIINNNSIATPYFFANAGSNSKVPRFLEISSSNTTVDIIISQPDYDTNNIAYTFDVKIRVLCYVYAYKGTVRGPAPNTLLMFHFFYKLSQSGGFSEQTGHDNILGLLKHNITANMQLSPYNNLAYTLNDPYNNVYTQYDLSNEFDMINDPDPSYWNTKDNDGAFTTYSIISNDFSDIYAIKCKRFDTGGTMDGSLTYTPILR